MRGQIQLIIESISNEEVQSFFREILEYDPIIEREDIERLIGNRQTVIAPLIQILKAETAHFLSLVENGEEERRKLKKKSKSK